MSGFNLDDYVDVAERIRLFYEKYPDGRLATIDHGEYQLDGQLFIYCKAAAYRTPDDPQPCNGIAWEPVPGATPYTRQSELMNAETSAWGRAIIAAGIPSKKIASREEVQNRQGSQATGARADSEPSNGKTRPELLKKLEDLVYALNASGAKAHGQENWKAYYSQKSQDLHGKLPSELTVAQIRSLIEDAEKELANATPEVPFG